MKMKKSKGNGKIMMTFGLLLTAAALFLTGYNLWGEYQAKKNANEALLQVVEVISEETADDGANRVSASNFAASGILSEVQSPESGDETAQTSESAASTQSMLVRMIAGQDYIGIVEIPALSLELPIINELDDAKLKIAPCRFMGSAYLGDFIISGHSYKNHFRYIRKLVPGDQIIFTDMGGTRFVYEVTSYEVIGGEDVERMLSGEWDMTLFTCTYNSTSRHTVRCRLVPEENPWMESVHVPHSTYNSDKNGWEKMTVSDVAAETTASKRASTSNTDTDGKGDKDEEEDMAIYQDANLINDLEPTAE